MESLVFLVKNYCHTLLSIVPKLSSKSYFPNCVLYAPHASKIDKEKKMFYYITIVSKSLTHSIVNTMLGYSLYNNGEFIFFSTQ